LVCMIMLAFRPFPFLREPTRRGYLHIAAVRTMSLAQ
jgi:hypothetical protein